MDHRRILALMSAGLLVAPLVPSFGWADQDAEEVCQDLDKYTPEMHEVLVDRAIGKAFVKTPCGWRFVRQVEKDRVDEAIDLSRNMGGSEGDSREVK